MIWYLLLYLCIFMLKFKWDCAIAHSLKNNTQENCPKIDHKFKT
jgi:hypothetical protein